MGEGVADGRYALRKLIGEGSTASVWRATDNRLGRDVAVKVVRPGALDATGRERARAESRALARFTHPHLVTLYDAHIAEDPDEPSYVVLELVDGAALRDVLADGPLPPVEVARIGAAVADALAHLHEHGVVHRDVKPANVLLGTDRTVKLADLGIARFLDGATRLTGTGLLVGTPAFLAPEQVDGGAVTGATDVYALGLVLLEALTGERAFEGSGIEAALARVHRDPEVPSTLPPRWRTLLAAMLARAPQDRIAAAALPGLLGELADDQSVDGEPVDADVAAAVPTPDGSVLTPTAVLTPTPVLTPTAVLTPAALTPTAALAAPSRGAAGSGRRFAAVGAVAAAVTLVVVLASTSGGTDRLSPPASGAPSTPTGAPAATSTPPAVPAAVRETAPQPTSTPVATRPVPVKHAPPAPHPKPAGPPSHDKPGKKHHGDG